MSIPKNKKEPLNGKKTLEACVLPGGVEKGQVKLQSNFGVVLLQVTESFHWPVTRRNSKRTGHMVAQCAEEAYASVDLFFNLAKSPTLLCVFLTKQNKAMILAFPFL